MVIGWNGVCHRRLSSIPSARHNRDYFIIELHAMRKMWWWFFRPHQFKTERRRNNFRCTLTHAYTRIQKHLSWPINYFWSKYHLFFCFSFFSLVSISHAHTLLIKVNQFFWEETEINVLHIWNTLRIDLRCHECHSCEQY